MSLRLCRLRHRDGTETISLQPVIDLPRLGDRLYVPKPLQRSVMDVAWPWSRPAARYRLVDVYRLAQSEPGATEFLFVWDEERRL